MPSTNNLIDPNADVLTPESTSQNLPPQPLKLPLGESIHIQSNQMVFDWMVLRDALYSYISEDAYELGVSVFVEDFPREINLSTELVQEEGNSESFTCSKAELLTGLIEALNQYLKSILEGKIKKSLYEIEYVKTIIEGLQDELDDENEALQIFKTNMIFIRQGSNVVIHEYYEE